MFEKLKLAQKTSADIDKLRDGYRPAAKCGAILFFVLAEMAVVNSMYQYSLAAYLDVFHLSLRKSMPDSILPKRLKNMMDTLMHNVYNYGCTGKRDTHGTSKRQSRWRLAGFTPSSSFVRVLGLVLEFPPVGAVSKSTRILS